MGLSTNCCLNPLPPPPNSPSIPSPTTRRTAQIACSPRKERSWQNQCLLGLTCAIIALESSNLSIIRDQERAIAVDMQTRSTIVRWSDKRACQQWRVNSLETIVPENLPRPSARRRWESTGFSEAAPPVNVVDISGAKSCFYL